MKSKKIRHFASLTVLIVLLAAVSISAQQKDEATILKAVTNVNQELMKAFASGDGAGVASFYAKNGQLLQPNGKTVSGREAIGKYWQGAIDSGIKVLKIEVAEAVGMKDKAATVGRYTIFDGDSRQMETGKYIVLWIQENGKWRLYRDIWNSDAAQN